MPPRTAGPPVHLRRGWDELFYVLEGEISFLIEGTTTVAPSGSIVLIPRGVLHTFWNEGAVPARQLTVFTNAGMGMDTISLCGERPTAPCARH